MTYHRIVPVVYSITPFLIYRPFESIRTYINHEAIPVKLIGSGRGKDYEHDGFSHHATDNQMVMEMFPNINTYFPVSVKELENNLTNWLTDRTPTYINLQRA
jgi:transketolase C-terminal domain/subunit